MSRFCAPDGAVLAVDHAVTKVALDRLGRVLPDTVPFEDLLADARRAVHGDAAGVRGPDPDRDGQVLAANLLTGFTYSPRLVELSVYRPRLAASVGERPEATTWPGISRREVGAWSPTRGTNASDSIRSGFAWSRCWTALGISRRSANAMDEPVGSVQACLGWLAGAELLRNGSRARGDADAPQATHRGAPT